MTWELSGENLAIPCRALPPAGPDLRTGRAKEWLVAGRPEVGPYRPASACKRQGVQVTTHGTPGRAAVPGRRGRVGKRTCTVSVDSHGHGPDGAGPSRRDQNLRRLVRNCAPEGASNRVGARCAFREGSGVDGKKRVRRVKRFTSGRGRGSVAGNSSKERKNHADDQTL